MSQWIPVSERLPEKGRRVMVSLVCESEYDGEKFKGGKYLDVTAWQPLPEPYKGEA